MIAAPPPTAKRWQTKPFPDAPLQRNAIDALTRLLNVTPYLASLLVQRGIHSFEEARSFFRPELSHLHDPFLMQDMGKAVRRLMDAMDRGEKILVYGDYDVDGTTSVALFYGFLREIYPNMDFYIPDRYTEGYGVSKTGVLWAAEHGFSLIVCLDCGIKSVDRVAEAKALGVDFIICDHHRPGELLPDAAAVLDPKRDDCNYPYKELTGCGVGFKLLQAYCRFNNLPEEPLLAHLDLLAVSIAADIVPITGENRVLTHFGLRQLNTAPRSGFRALLDIAGITAREITIQEVVFGISPRINAAGRIKHAKAAVELLLASTPNEADSMAEGINKNNTDRKGFDTSITDQALAMIRASETLCAAKSTVLFDPGWHKGVVGIVASRCIENFYRPTIILTQSQGKATGSARSVAGFDVYEAIEECADLLIQFGGHTHAAGLTIELDMVPLFRQKFEEVVSRRITDEQLVPLVEIDIPLDFDAIDAKFYRVMKQMAPFGPQNMAPVFCTDDAYLVGLPTVMKEKHLKLKLRQGPATFGKPAQTLTAIGWNMAHFASQIPTNGPFSICYSVEENHFNGGTELQLNLKDVRC